ncbi:MAG TPA: FN3 associated domain-containing protein [Bacteroidales bacterium]|nr:FN3 associated domain-containing protein [Bacteroidales bacterium]
MKWWVISLNLIAELNSLVEGYDEESARLEIRKFLEERFKSTINDCYQKVMVFPPVDQIKIESDKILLVLSEPNLLSSGLNPDLVRLYEDAQYKNRIMFLTGDRNTMDSLLRKAKEFKAIQRIIANMKSERVSESNPQFAMAVDREIKIGQQLLSAARETFVKLYYPFHYRGEDRLVDAEFLMDFRGNDFNGEDQIKKVLTEKQKFTTENPTSGTFKDKCLQRLFTLDEMRREDLKNRAASSPVWQWHHPKALDELIEHCLKTGTWCQAGNYIQKNPPKEETSVTIQATWPDKNSSAAVLNIIPKFGDTVFYEYDQEPTTVSDKITDFNRWRTDEMIVWFLCVDSKGEYKTGKPVKWVNKINLRYKTYDAGDQKKMKLEASVAEPKILYTTDGTDPKAPGAAQYNDDFIIPKNTRYVLAIAEKKGIRSDQIEVSIDWKKPEGLKIDRNKPLEYHKKGMVKTSSNKQTYDELALFYKYHAVFSDVSINSVFKTNGDDHWAQVIYDSSLKIPKEKIEAQIDFLRSSLGTVGSFETSLQIGVVHFLTGQDFEDWIAEKQMQLSSLKQEEIKQ